jgi:hypothetical protein
MGSNHRVFVLACGGPEDRHGSHWRGDWGFWDAGPEFVTHYSGRVAAAASVSCQRATPLMQPSRKHEKA